MPRKLVVDCMGRCRRQSREYGFHGAHTSERRTCPQPVWNQALDQWDTCGGRLHIRSLGGGRWDKRITRRKPPAPPKDWKGNTIEPWSPDDGA